ncbi:MAG: hypothetical protein LBD70_00510 [Bifidobacteriaceae bacterium]|nr:hypothetical protein [Bifidobacteriaceae bacterium]
MGESSPKNIEYQASLSDEAAREYDLALHGPNPYESSDALADESCLGQAVTANPADGPGASLSPADQFAAQFWDLGRAMDDLVFSGVRADQAVIEANAAWALCMDAKGYDLASGNLYSADQVEPWTAHTLALRTKADGSLGDAWYNYSSDDATPEDERSLGGWPAEIAIAVDDFDCRHDTDYETVYRDVQLRLEEEFVEYNKDRLDMMVAYVTGIG